MNRPRKNKLSSEQILDISLRIHGYHARKTVKEEPQSEESKKEYLSLAEEKRQRKNSKRLAIFK